MRSQHSTSPFDFIQNRTYRGSSYRGARGLVEPICSIQISHMFAQKGVLAYPCDKNMRTKTFKKPTLPVCGDPDDFGIFIYRIREATIGLR